MNSELPGLAPYQVTENRAKYGSNSIPSTPPRSALQLYLSQFLNPLVLILLASGIFTVLLHEYVDAVVILLVILINGTLGFFQENKAQKALEALRNIIKPEITVVRGGKEMIILSEELVVGDIIRLKLGDKVPADAVVLQSSNLALSEAVLTGEAIPVVKKPASGKEDELNTVFMGTTVLSGYGLCRVVRVGLETAFGKIAKSLSTEKESATPLQIKLNRFSRQITVVVFIAAISVIIIELIKGQATVVEIVSLGVSLAVSAIPEGLVISVTVVLTLGLQRLLKRKALVRKLIVAETLGSVTTICVDKTGTLTEGNMKVISVSFVDDELARKALLAVNRELNSVDSALAKWLGKNSTGNKDAVFKNDRFIDDVPFNSENKYAISIHEKHSYMVGAPEKLLAESKINAADRKMWQQRMHIESAKGRRLVGVAYKPAGKDNASISNNTWLGFVVIEDPIRKNLNRVFQQFTEAGIRVKIITGDQKTTAKYVAETIGITLDESEMISGEELEKLSESETKKILPNIKLFYRTSPQQKYTIVQTLQDMGEVVAMMGDGINDAPALKRADIGIVVENATQVSKETADMILLDSNLNTIAAAIEEGRSIFENTRKVVAYLLTDSTSEIILVLASIIFGLPLPLMPLQILFINLIADGFPDIALAFEKTEKSLMKRKPLAKKTPLINREMIEIIATIGIVVNIIIFAVYVTMLDNETPIAEARSFIFFLLAVQSLFYVYPVRSLSKNLWEINIFGNMMLNFAVIVGFIFVVLSFNVPFLSQALELVPLSLDRVLLAFGLSFLSIVIIEAIKWFNKIT